MCTALGIISSPLSIAERHDGLETRGKWSLAKNRRQTTLKLFWQQSIAQWATPFVHKQS